MKRVILLVVLLLGCGISIHAQPPQKYPDSYELVCPPGSTPLSGPTGTAFNPTTGKFRANFCVDPFGNISMNVTNTATGISACIVNGSYTAGSFCYQTIQSAINAAAPVACGFSHSLCGKVLIPPKYAGTDTWTNPNNVLIVDERSNFGSNGATIAYNNDNGAFFLTTFSRGGGQIYPAGGDFNIVPIGPAGMYFRRMVIATTTTASLSIGQNSNVLVTNVQYKSTDLGDTLGGTGTTANLDQGPSQVMTIGADTANFENITFVSGTSCPTASTWAIVDGTHLCLNTAKTHAGTTSIIEPEDPMRFDGTNWDFRSVQTALPTDASGCRTGAFRDSVGDPIWFWPANITCTAPRNWPTIGFGVGLNWLLGSGYFGGSQPAPSTWESLSLGVNNTIAFNNKDQSGVQRGFIGPFFGADNGALQALAGNFPARYLNNTFIGWMNAAGTDFNCIGSNALDQFLLNTKCNAGGGASFQVVLAASLTTTASTTDNVTITGMTASGHCSVMATNAGAAGGIASVFVSAKAANQITVTHTATAGWTFDILCTPN